uniref:Uncharacterized protein n=1 Tax=Globodera rostochiensis TaxID=31243 RepID=A0A914I177_GLORO
MEAIARSIVLFVLFVAPDYSYGLTCKIGGAHQLSGENATIGTCEGGYVGQSCVDIVCMKANAPETAMIIWKCSDEIDKKACTNGSYAAEYNELLHTTNASCECNFGEEGTDRTNVEAKLPEIPPTPTLSPEAASVCKEPGFKCKSGLFDENGFGQTSIADWKNNYTFWGIAADNDCYKLSDYFAFGYACHCKFGAKGVQKSNMNFMLPEYMAPSPLVSGIRDKFLTKNKFHAPRTRKCT